MGFGRSLRLSGVTEIAIMLVANCYYYRPNGFSTGPSGILMSVFGRSTCQFSSKAASLQKDGVGRRI